MQALDHSSSPWVRVIIVNYNGGSMLERCLASLAAQDMADFEAIVVDNASTDPPVDGAKLPDLRFRLVRSPSNIGFAAANNVASRDCRAAWIATLNPDAFPGRDWLTELRAATLRYPWAHAFGSTQLDANNSEIVDGFGDAYSAWGSAWRSFGGRPIVDLPPHDHEIFSPCAAAALYRADSFQAVGGFDADFFCYLEDVDLGFRLRLQGRQCVQVRHAVVRHVGSATTGSGSSFTIMHSFRNRLWLLFKNVPLPLLLLLASIQLPATLLSAIGCRDRERRRAALEGFMAGLRGLPLMARKRRQIQRERRIGNLQAARLIVWAPSRRGRHGSHYRPVPGATTQHPGSTNAELCAK